MIRCHRCGLETPRLTVDQRRCPACERTVAAIIAADERRRAPRFAVSKELTTWPARRAA